MEMKDRIIDIHPTLGPITYKDLIVDLELLLEDSDILEKRIQNIMEYNNYDDETIASLLSDNIPNRLEWIIFVLKTLL